MCLHARQNGPLAVAGTREIAPTINNLLTYPFAMRVATKDFHPKDHISFASNHPAPNNKPFESEITIENPYNSAETQKTLLWPDHCVQGTPGTDLIPELDTTHIQLVFEKGQDPRVEMYSAFAAPFKSPPVASSGLAETLRVNGITHVYVVGVAFDYCVKYTAIDSAKEGFKTFVVEEATKAVNPSSAATDTVLRDFGESNVQMIHVDGKELERVKRLS